MMLSVAPHVALYAIQYKNSARKTLKSATYLLNKVSLSIEHFKRTLKNPDIAANLSNLSPSRKHQKIRGKHTQLLNNEV